MESQLWTDRHEIIAKGWRSHFPGRASSRLRELSNGFAEEQASDGAELEIDIDVIFTPAANRETEKAGEMSGGEIAYFRLVPRVIRFGSGRTIIQEMKQKAEPMSPDGVGLIGRPLWVDRSDRHHAPIERRSSRRNRQLFPGRAIIGTFNQGQ